VAIGKYIAAKAGYKPQVLELGGNDPIIVMDDADLDEASRPGGQRLYKNSGQRCTAVKRMLVHEKVAADFTDAVVAKTRAWTYGDPPTPDVDMGTVIDARGAAVRAPGQRRRGPGRAAAAGNQRDGALYAPTVIDRVKGEMTVVQARRPSARCRR
jgi:acyl-CoA reductase-like NAD-dependent aldehyde dehydrogenase